MTNPKASVFSPTVKFICFMDMAIVAVAPRRTASHVFKGLSFAFASKGRGVLDLGVDGFKRSGFGIPSPNVQKKHTHKHPLISDIPIVACCNAFGTFHIRGVGGL